MTPSRRARHGTGILVALAVTFWIGLMAALIALYVICTCANAQTPTNGAILMQQTITNPTTVTFGDWAQIVACASKATEPLPTPPTAGEPTDDFIRHYTETNLWGMRQTNQTICQTAVAAWHAGWAAAHAGKPDDPVAAEKTSP